MLDTYKKKSYVLQNISVIYNRLRLAHLRGFLLPDIYQKNKKKVAEKFI